MELLELREDLQPVLVRILWLLQIHVNGTAIARGAEELMVSDEPVAGLRVPAETLELAEPLGVGRELVAVDGLAGVVHA